MTRTYEISLRQGQLRQLAKLSGKSLLAKLHEFEHSADSGATHTYVISLSHNQLQQLAKLPGDQKAAKLHEFKLHQLARLLERIRRKTKQRKLERERGLLPRVVSGGLPSLGKRR